jgi:hypothetical protein
MTINTCSTCRYWSADNDGECRRSAPRFINVGPPDRPAWVSLWPPVVGSKGCGEYSTDGLAAARLMEKALNAFAARGLEPDAGAVARLWEQAKQAEGIADGVEFSLQHTADDAPPSGSCHICGAKEVELPATAYVCAKCGTVPRPKGQIGQ